MKYQNGSVIDSAARLADEYAGRLRWCAERNSWLEYDGKIWRPGTGVGCVMDLARRIRVEAEDATDRVQRRSLEDWAHKLDNLYMVNSVLKLARADARLAVSEDEFDADLWLLCASNGVIDLQTATLGPHDPKHLMTRMSPVAYDPTATHELWDRWLSEATSGDVELAQYLQRWAGYCATGLNTEKRFVLVYGAPNTGKSTLADAVRAALGSYAIEVEARSWVQQSIRSDMSALRGMRLATTTEFDTDKRFDEALIRRITGDDPSQGGWRYRSKLWFAANNAPRISARDAGMWDRGHRVPFNHVVEVKDPTIKDRLRDPLVCGPAVLAWLVEGCIAWQAYGLGSCNAVVGSTSEYQRENNPIARFVHEWFRTGESLSVPRYHFNHHLTLWCKANRVSRPSAQDTAATMRALGYGEKTVRGIREWVGLELSPDRGAPNEQ